MFRVCCTFVFTVCIVFCCEGQSSSAVTCRTFDIYKGIDSPKPELIDDTSSIGETELIAKIGQIPGHENFPALFTKSLKDKEPVDILQRQWNLYCIQQYLLLDNDNDGQLDWKLVADGRLLSHLLPKDNDWDNDGIINIFDPNPREKNKLTSQDTLPVHLQLTSHSGAEANELQRDIFNLCGVVVLNHTGVHSLRSLQLFKTICEKTLARFKRHPYTFVLYAFAGHAYVSDVVASYYPFGNFMSVAGNQWSHDTSEAQLLSVLTHEIGHFLIFTLLSPQELYEVARLFGKWKLPKQDLHSFYDPILLETQALNSSPGYLPSRYSRTNIHEWFSEVLSTHLKEGLNSETKPKPHASLPTGLKKWIQGKF